MKKFIFIFKINGEYNEFDDTNYAQFNLIELNYTNIIL